MKSRDCALASDLVRAAHFCESCFNKGKYKIIAIPYIKRALQQ